MINVEVGYRSESVYGEGFTDAVSVITHEVDDLDNVDILSTLADTVLTGTKLGDTLTKTVDDPEMLDELLGENPEKFVRDQLLPAVRQATGVDIKYVLWLCATAADVVDIYNAAPEDVIAYPVGDVVLSDLGQDGLLYGYAEKPEPVEASA